MTQYPWPRTLPYRKGSVLVHYHEELESCTVDCYYMPSTWTRIKAWFRL